MAGTPAATSIADEHAVDLLAAHLLDPARTRPVAVVTHEWGKDSPAFDVEELRSRVGDVCDIVEIATGVLTFRLTELLPPRTGAWAGAARVYAIDPAWKTDPFASPLRMPGGRGDAAASMLQRLESDALIAARASGAFERAQASSVSASGVVRGFPHPDRALVALDGGGIAIVPHELVAPELPFAWALRVGDTVRGRYERSTGRLIPDTAPFSTATLADGAVVLALVEAVEPERATLRLHPGTAIEIGRSAVSANPLDTLDLLLTPGEVVAGRIDRSGGAMTLLLHDVDDDEPVLPAPPVVAGGPPWLIEGRSLPVAMPDLAAGLLEASAADHPGDPALVVGHLAPPAGPVVDAPPSPPRAERPGPQQVAAAAGARRIVPVPVPVPPARRPATALRDVQLQLADLQGQLQREQARRADAEESARRFEREADQRERQVHEFAARLDAEKRKSTRRGGALRDKARTEAVDRASWFHDPDAWARFEIGIAWAERVPAGEKAMMPLPDYDLDERFADSLRSLGPTDLRKALRAVVDVLTDRVGSVPARQAHRLRSGAGGDDPIVQRPTDHAVCWRAYVENVVAQAKRLHWWAIPGGRVELIRIVTHDETDP